MWLNGWTTTITALFRMGKDHASRNGLQYTSYGDFDGHAHILPPTFNDDHSAIIQVAYPLAEFFAILHDLDMDIFSGEEYRFNSIGKFIDIQYFHAL